MPLKCGAVITCRESYECSMCARAAGPVNRVEYIDVLGVRRTWGPPLVVMADLVVPSKSLVDILLRRERIAGAFGIVCTCPMRASRGIWSCVGRSMQPLWHLLSSRSDSHRVFRERFEVTERRLQTHCASHSRLARSTCHYESLIYGCVGTCELEFCCSSSVLSRPSAARHLRLHTNILHVLSG